MGALSSSAAPELLLLQFEAMGVVERSREVMAVMALHEALRNVCTDSDWTYSVFWTIRPRPRLRGGLGCKSGDEGSLMLMWEDGYCRPAGTTSAPGAAPADGNPSAAPSNNDGLVHHEGIRRIHSNSSLNLGDDVEEDDPVRKAFRKMSIQLYNYGEGLMGKVASDKCHKWVFRESSETEVGPLNYWQSSFDSHPPEWTDQFSAGIQTIAVIQAGHGLLQLGSCKIVAEDLHFVLRMRYTFESLENHAGGFLSQTFAPMRNRFFCGTSPTGGAVPPPVPWSNGQFYQNSDFRLRLGVSNDAVAAQDYLRAAGNDDSNNITSLRLSLQNASCPAGDRSLSFDFRSSEHDGDAGGANNSHGFSGIKRPAGSTLVSGPADGRANLLSRRMQFNKMNHHPLADNSTTFQQLLECSHSVGFSSPQTAVFLGSNGTIPGTPTNPNLDHNGGLMVQIPPVIANTPSPMISPMSGSKIQRTGDMSPMIQAALQEAMERSQQQQPRSGNSSPLAIRLAKLADQPQFNGGGNCSHPGTPTRRLSDITPAHSPFPGSHPATPNHATPDHHFSHPGTPQLNSTPNEMHFLEPSSESHPGTPNKHSAPPHHPDNYLNNTNSNGCHPDHSSGLIHDTSSYTSGSNKHERSDHLQIPTAPWDNLKEALDMQSNNTDFVMDGFFE